MGVMRIAHSSLKNTQISAVCSVSAKFGQMSVFLKLQIICDNLMLGETHDIQNCICIRNRCSWTYG